MTLDLNNLSARRGFFDVHTPISEQPALLMSVQERKQQQREIIEFCNTLRDEVYDELGRPNKKNLRYKFKKRVFHRRQADLVRIYFSLGERIHEIEQAIAKIKKGW